MTAAGVEGKEDVCGDEIRPGLAQPPARVDDVVHGGGTQLVLRNRKVASAIPESSGRLDTEGQHDVLRLSSARLEPARRRRPAVADERRKAVRDHDDCEEDDEAKRGHREHSAAGAHACLRSVVVVVRDGLNRVDGLGGRDSVVARPVPHDRECLDEAVLLRYIEAAVGSQLE